MRSTILLATTLLCALALSAPAAAAPPPKPFSADYEVLQDGKKLGTGRIELRALGNSAGDLSNRLSHRYFAHIESDAQAVAT